MSTSAKPKYKILVVDDDIDLNTSFALLLEFDGHEVHTAYTGEAAMLKLAANHFDLLISEYWLPRLRGDQLAAMVKQRWPDLPIILVTANFEEILGENHPIAGVSCLLDKPFSMSQLREAMDWAIGRQTEPPPGESTPRWIHSGYRAPSQRPPDAPNDTDDF